MITKEKMIKKVANFVKEIADGRTDGEVDVKESLLDKYSFSSIDVMDLLIKIRDEYFRDNEDIDAGTLLNDIYTNYEAGTLSVQSITDIVYNNALA